MPDRAEVNGSMAHVAYFDAAGSVDDVVHDVAREPVPGILDRQVLDLADPRVQWPREIGQQAHARIPVRSQHVLETPIRDLAQP